MPDAKLHPKDTWLPKHALAVRKRRAAERHIEISHQFTAQAEALEAEVRALCLAEVQPEEHDEILGI